MARKESLVYRLLNVEDLAGASKREIPVGSVRGVSYLIAGCTTVQGAVAV